MMYSRVLLVWVLLSILVLLIVLFSSPSGGLPVMIFTFIWMFMLLLGIFFLCDHNSAVMMLTIITIITMITILTNP
uniref:NADH dehydrogenase subunit 6 n=1 Tax=Ditylenchus dipsaci TaxID=166011 RepID=A0A915CZ09_9BILA